MFSYQTIQKTLLNETPTRYEIKHAFDSEGPGEMDIFKIVRGKEKDIFYQVGSAMGGSSSGKMVILSSPFLRDRPLKKVELGYFTALIKHYDVYFWLGPQVSLPQTPLHHMEAFLKQRKNIQPASRDQVILHLGNQGIAVSNTIILDQLGLSQAMQRLAELLSPDVESEIPEAAERTEKKDYKFSLSSECYSFLEKQKIDTLDLTWVTDLEHLKETTVSIADVNRITTIKCTPLIPMEELFRLFPKVTSIEIAHPFISWVVENLSFFPATITLILDGIDSRFCPESTQKDRLLVSDEIKVTHLTIKNTRNLTFIANPGNKLTQLKFVNCLGLKCKLTNIPALTSLEFDDCTVNLDSLQTDNHLTTLTVLNCYLYKRLQLVHFPQLSALTFKRSGVKKLDVWLNDPSLREQKEPIQHTSLRTVEIEARPEERDEENDLFFLNFTYYTKLTTITLINNRDNKNTELIQIYLPADSRARILEVEVKVNNSVRKKEQIDVLLAMNPHLGSPQISNIDRKKEHIDRKLAWFPSLHSSQIRNIEGENINPPRSSEVKGAYFVLNNSFFRYPEEYRHLEACRIDNAIEVIEIPFIRFPYQDSNTLKFTEFKK